MFKEITVYKKNENAETVFKATDNLGESYLYHGTQIIEMIKCEITHTNSIMLIIMVLASISILNIFTALETSTVIDLMNSIVKHEAPMTVMFSIPLNIVMCMAAAISIPVVMYSNNKDKKIIKYIIKESDGMIEQTKAKPKDMTHFKT